MRVKYRDSEDANMIRQAVTFQAKDEQRVGPKTEAKWPGFLAFCAYSNKHRFGDPS